jgi:hypothetical protein
MQLDSAHAMPDTPAHRREEVARAEVRRGANLAKEDVDFTVGSDYNRAVHEICLDEFAEKRHVGKVGRGAVGEDAHVSIAVGCDNTRGTCAHG